MSWLDQIKTQLTIKTGDGQIHTPQWINARKKTDFNVKKFEFINIKGSLVDRKEIKGTEYNIELYFQGEFHLVDAKFFQDSTADKRAWVIQHPFYGLLRVQPISLDYDNSALNISKITGTVIETITTDYPTGTIQPKDAISVDAINVSQIYSTSAANQITINPIPAAPVVAKTKNSLKDKLQQFQLKVSKLVSNYSSDFNKYFNIYNQAYQNIDSLTSDASNVLNLLQSVINQPALFNQDVKSRFTMLGYQFNTLRASLTGTTSNYDKLMYSTLAGGTISALCLACANPVTGDFLYSADVYNTITDLLAYYNQYLLDLDFIQTTTGGNTTSFFADADSLVLLSSLVNFTLSNLFAIALNGLQQRSIVLEYDSNWIVLTHRFYGLDQSDENLTKLMQQNNAGLNSILQVKKNTRIYYYI